MSFEGKLYEEGCVIVIFKDGVSETQAMTLINSLGLSLKTKRQWIRFATIKVPIGEEHKWISEFRKHNIVKVAELNAIRHLVES